MGIEENSITDTLAEIQQVVQLLRQNCEDMNNHINIIIQKIVRLMTEILQAESESGQPDGKIPIDRILEYLKILNAAYNSRDIVLLADVLEYEISGLLYLYIESGDR